MTRDEFMLSQYLAILNADSCLTEDAHNRREEALEVLAAIMDKVELDNVSLDQIFTAYFICTYALTHEKHAIKKKINHIVRSNLLHHEINDVQEIKIEKKKRPTCLVITNSFTSSHVMYRVFGKSLRALRQHFRTVNICLHRTDYEAAQCFDRVTVAENIGHANYVDVMRSLRELLLKEHPDIILYADIAMHPFGVMLSNLQLAPVQAVLSGHPAPSKSPQIPYFIVEDSYKGFTPDFEEEMIFYPENLFSVRTPIIKALDLRQYRIEHSMNKVRAIVPVSLHKITWPFLKTLRTIYDETGVEFHITSNTTQGQEQVSELIRNIVPESHFYPALTYDEYIQLIATCDLFLLTFPFSGFSTVEDCLSQGVPGIVMQGDDMASHQGAVMVRRTGNHSIIAHSRLDYINKAVQLIRDTPLRSALRHALLRADWRDMSLFLPSSPGIASALAGLAKEHGLML